jgi:hypothetical protein
VLRRPLELGLHAAITVMDQRVDAGERTIVERLLEASSARSLRSELDTRQPTIRRARTSMTNAT